MYYRRFFMSKFIMSAFADEYADSLDEQLEALARHGIGYLELRHADKINVRDMTPENVERVEKALKANGIKLSALGSPIGKVKLTDDIDAHLDAAKRMFETAVRLEAPYVRMFSFYSESGFGEKEREQVFTNVEKLLDLADTYGLKLCHENEARIFGESPERCLELLEHFGGRLKAVFDMGNFVLDGYKPFPDAYDKLFPYIEYFHIKDSLYAGAIVPAGRGEATIAEILREHMARTDKDFFVSLEPHLECFSGLNALVGKKFENPYKFENKKVAFDFAVDSLKEIMK